MAEPNPSPDTAAHFHDVDPILRKQVADALDCRSIPKSLRAHEQLSLRNHRRDDHRLATLHPPKHGLENREVRLLPREEVDERVGVE